MKKLWIVFIAILACSFAVLGWVGTEIFRQAPPIPREVAKRLMENNTGTRRAHPEFVTPIAPTAISSSSTIRVLAQALNALHIVFKLN